MVMLVLFWRRNNEAHPDSLLEYEAFQSTQENTTIVIISEEKQFTVVLISCSSSILKPSIEVYPLTVLF